LPPARRAGLARHPSDGRRPRATRRNPPLRGRRAAGHAAPAALTATGRADRDRHGPGRHRDALRTAAGGAPPRRGALHRGRGRPGSTDGTGDPGPARPGRAGHRTRRGGTTAADRARDRAAARRARGGRCLRVQPVRLERAAGRPALRGRPRAASRRSGAALTAAHRHDPRHAARCGRHRRAPGRTGRRPQLDPLPRRDPRPAGPFLAAAVATGGTVAVADWPELTTQPGDAYRDLLSRMGAKVWREGETVCVRGGGAIHGIDADMSAMGELVPTIAALAALADSPTRLRGVGHLRGHETDRLQALSTELTKVGARTIEHEDGLEIHPGSLHGTEFETYEDHRIATAAAIIGLKVPDMKVVNIGTTAKTLPDFVGMWLSMLHAQGPEGEQR